MGHHHEVHRVHRAGWLRASVLGANDGVISIASLLVGVAAAQMASEQLLLIGLAGLIGGALSMAAGEYISVGSQADMESADLAREAHEIRMNPQGEHRELKQIYIQRGLTPELADQVSLQLMAHDALQAHARDELGISHNLKARPLQAALSSAMAFLLGGVVPILVMLLAISQVQDAVTLSWIISSASLLCLTMLGALAAYLGRAPLLTGMLRVTLWGAAAMALTAVLGVVVG
jgi:VIT1/CCC1 family predicted Fe2+/Mn2+ transporter